MGLKIDFHVHTCYSRDSSITLKEVITYAKKRGLDGVAITYHNTIKGVLKLKACEILIIPGIEVSTLNGHLLGINLEVPIPKKRSIEETIHRIHKEGGLAIAPHPVALYKSPPSRNVNSYDAVEVMNASSFPFTISTNLSKRFANNLGLPQIGGSDSHYPPEIGSVYTVVDAENNIEDVVSAIKQGATCPVGKGIPLKIRLERFALNLKRKI